LSCRLSLCCPLPSSVLPFVVMPPVAVVMPPVAVVVPPVALLPLARRMSPSSCHVVMPPVAFCVPWRPIGGIGPYQGTVALPMMYRWSECPWMCQTGADGVNTMTSMTMMSSCQKYHGCARLWMETPYPTGAKY
jgi:hypothetical protein